MPSFFGSEGKRTVPGEMRLPERLILWGDEITLNLRRRTYRTKKRRILPVWSGGHEGSFDEFDHLNFEHKASLNLPIDTYVVYLLWKNPGRKAMILGEWLNRVKAYRRFKEYAKMLNLPMMDITGDVPVVLEAKEADLTLWEKAKSNRATTDCPVPATIPEPPPGSGIHLSLQRDFIHFVFHPFRLWIVLGIAIILLGAVAFVLIQQGGAFVLKAPLFIPIAAGACFALPLIFFLASRRHVVIERDNIRSYVTILRIPLWQKSLQKHAIEQIQLVEEEATLGTSILITTAESCLNFGEGLTKEDKRWLVEALKAAAVDGA